MEEMLSFKVAVLTPYKALYNICKHYIEKHSLNWELEMISSENILSLGKKYKNENYSLILSRGGLAKKLRDFFNFEVIEFEISQEVILKILYKYRNFKEKIAVIENKSFIDNIKKINNILKLELFYYKVDDISEFSKKIKQAHNEGAKVIIGGSFGTEILDTIEKLELDYELITSDYDSIEMTFHKARTFFKGKLSERKNNIFLEKILSSFSKGIIVVDTLGIIKKVNKNVCSILKKENLLSKHICQILPNFNEEDIFENDKQVVLEYQMTKLVIEIKKIENIGSIFFIQIDSDILKLENTLRKFNQKNGFIAKYTLENIIGESKIIRKAKERAEIFSKVSSSVLITGESGTGKELFAQAIHNLSERKFENFVAINCSAFPKELLESELFGYREGAFTGSRKNGKQGLIEIANGGTLFLDEISEMDITLQSKLLRVLSENEFIKLGDDRVLSIDIKIISATNKNLLEEIENNRFRRDLYYRLNILNLELPSLEGRKDDISILVEYFIDYYNKKFKHNVKGISPELLDYLQLKQWTGNVRELKNFMEKIIAVTQYGIIGIEILDFFSDKQLVKSSKTLKEIEKEIIEKMLLKYGNKSQVAKILNIDRGTLNRKLEF